MVVMERVKCDEKDDWPEDAREQVKAAIGKLHAKGLVFGDLRAPNVLFPGGKVCLIDFDWAGKMHEARHPHSLSTLVDWPASARVLKREPITASHDLFMLDKLFSQKTVPQ
jgi:serine/threonine-protein kinase RIO1